MANVMLLNKVTNGDFSNGTTGWYYSSGVTIADGQTTFTANGSTVYIQQAHLYTAASKTGHKLYVKYNVVSNSLVGSGSLRCGGYGGDDFCTVTQIPSTVGINSVEVVVKAGNANQLSLYITSGYTSGALVINNISVIDITEPFTSPNEPTAAQMDELLSFLPNKWFDKKVLLILDKENNKSYTNLITSEYSEKPNFQSYLLSYLDKISETVNWLNNFDILFNLDQSTGDQLDKCGEYANISRILPVNITNIPSILDDDTFRMVIKAKILKNVWNGTIQGLNDILSIILPDISVEVVDNQDMSATILIMSSGVSNMMKALIQNGFIIPKPSGVSYSYTFQTGYLFGWDTENTLIKGWDEGTWRTT